MENSESITFGLLWAILSLICNGSFSSLNKLPSVQASNISPEIFNLYFSFGVIFSSYMIYIVLLICHINVTFTYLGVISGILLGLSGLTTFAAIKKIGLSVSVAIWSGVAILVSFLEGLYTGVDIDQIYLSYVGLILIIIGIVGVGFSENIIQSFCYTNDELKQNPSILTPQITHATPHSQHFFTPKTILTPKINNKANNNFMKHNDTMKSLANANDLANPSIMENDMVYKSLSNKDISATSSPSNIPKQTGILILFQYTFSVYINILKVDRKRNNNINKNGSKNIIVQNVTKLSDDELYYELEYNHENSVSKWFLGIFYSILTGIFGGTVGFPSTYTDDTNKEIKYMYSFGTGVLVFIPFLFGIICFSNQKIEWNFKTCFIPGMLSGIIWNAGNLASLYAIKSLGYSVAYPIMQSSLIIASLWGIFIWGEILHKKTIIFLLFCSIIVVIGCALLTLGNDG